LLTKGGYLGRVRLNVGNEGNESGVNDISRRKRGYGRNKREDINSIKDNVNRQTEIENR
jgi:hypothetical protein